MVRTFAILAVAAAASAWASAQGPTVGLTAAQQAKLFQKNRDLLAGLVDRTLELAAADTPLARTAACQKAAECLSAELRRAADRDDPDRVAELAEYLSASLTHGLTPTAADAHRVIPAGSDGEKALRELHAAAVADARAAAGAVPKVGRVGQSRLVADALAKLSAACDGLAAAVPAGER